jgi:hypothetical protein
MTLEAIVDLMKSRPYILEMGAGKQQEKLYIQLKI